MTNRRGRKRALVECVRKYWGFQSNWVCSPGEKREKCERRLIESPQFKGERLPTMYEIEELRKHRVPCDVDPEVRGVIIKLNQNGFRTGGSCAGHPPYEKRGFISIMIPPAYLDKEDRNNIARIARNGGLKNITLTEQLWEKEGKKDRSVRGRSAEGTYVALNFDAVGNRYIRQRARTTRLEKAVRMVRG